MKIKLILPLITLLISTSIAKAQTNAATEEATIRQTLQAYLDGWATGDTTLLSKAMHSSCQLKSYINNTFSVTDRQKYLSFHTPHARSSDTKTSILTVNHRGTAAGAILQIETANRKFTDYMNLLKIEGEWLIVDKISYVENIK